LRLAEFIRRNREVIISEWVTFARTLLPPGRTASVAALRDHAAGILYAIARDMEVYQSAASQAAKAQGRHDVGPLGGAGKRHATRRIETGFRLDQVVAEYRALRASVLRLWAESSSQEIDPEEVTRFNEAIDETLAESTSRYMQMLDRHRDQFLGILGHDLRNPLGAIIMSSSVLAATETIDDKSARIASRILHSAQRMDRLVGDLLDLTRTRLGTELPIRRAPTDLAHVGRQVIAELRGAHPETPVRFEVKGHIDGEWDADRLSQLVSNLVGNALQHGQKGRPVLVRAHTDGEDAVLEVHNEGPPIPQRSRRSIFEPMVRISASPEGNRSKSLGLGLFVAEQVVLAHRGTIEVTSTKSGGTTFVVRLPQRAPPADDGVVVPALALPVHDAAARTRRPRACARGARRPRPAPSRPSRPAQKRPTRRTRIDAARAR
jgi:signal transduction histidine kinase